MKTIDFTITQGELNVLLKNTKDGKNYDIGKIAVEAVKLYFLKQDPKAVFKLGKKNEPDIIVTFKGVSVAYEIKGTQSDDIAYDKLKVSSKYCHNALVNGMEIIRITNIRNREMKIHILKYGEDFLLIPEPRWSIKPLKHKRKTK